jgi:hypothetical protein
MKIIFFGVGEVAKCALSLDPRHSYFVERNNERVHPVVNGFIASIVDVPRRACSPPFLREMFALRSISRRLGRASKIFLFLPVQVFQRIFFGDEEPLFVVVQHAEHWAIAAAGDDDGSFRL